MKRYLLIYSAAGLIMFCFVAAFLALAAAQDKPSLQWAIDCMVQKDEHGASLLLCREWYKPATPAQKEAFCHEQWRLFLKPYRQSGRPPTNASMEGCEGIPQPRLTLEELERP